MAGGELNQEPTYTIETTAARERLAARRATRGAETLHTRHERNIEVGTHSMEDTDDEGELTVDIYDEEDAIVIQSTVAGVKPENLDVSITDDTITIRGRRIRPESVDDSRYYYKELFWGGFSRSIILPEPVEENATEATLQHGLLTVKLQKRKQGVTQKIKVKMN